MLLAKERDKSKIVIDNEVEANKTVAVVYLVSLAIFSLIFILNILGIFIIDKPAMTICFVSSAVLIMLPSVFNRVFGPETRWLKFVYVIIACLFLLIVTTTVTYHAVILYTYPIAVASLYFSRRMTIGTTILTLIVTIIGQVAGYVLDWRTDNNFETWHGLIVFGIIPRSMTLLAVAALLCFISARSSKLLRDKEKEYRDLQALNRDIIYGFSNMVENRDESTGGHITRTSRYVEILSEKLMADGYRPEAINKEFIQYITLVAPLHDIGKVAIPDSILKKPGKLTSEEFEIMKTHSAKGADIIQNTFAHIGDEGFRRMAYAVVRYHHEKWNGKGYPDGLKEEEIPLPARIMSVADVFDAVSSKRCYRDAMDLDECFKIIEEGVGRDFDPDIARAFLSIKDLVIEVKNSIHEDEA